MKETAGRFFFALTVVLVAATVACASRDEKDISRASAEEIAEDSEALSQLLAAGSDFTKPHKVEFYLYVPSEAAAEAAATAVRPLGYTATVSAGADAGQWVCLASRTMLPTIQEITIARSLFKGLALKYEGAYGGWNTAIER